MQKVYLAGGMRIDWRERIKKECRGLVFFCPVDKETSRAMTVDEYGTWDLHYIKQADIVFGYMERTNPSGIGLACEIGMAYGIGKTVILVLEKDSQHFPDEKLAFMRKVAHITFSDLQEGINYLKTFRLRKKSSQRKKNISVKTATSKRTR
jgi:nucleoside 2-deoxyribosyltransferase